MVKERIEALLAKKERSLIEKAACIAYFAHEAQVRKDDGAPYFLHLSMVGMMLSQCTERQEVIAAGLVHDVLEDTGIDRGFLEVHLGCEVARIVSSVTESGKDVSWEDRKAAYIAGVVSAEEDVRLVSIADKLHNLQGLLAGQRANPTKFWQSFSRGKEAQLKFYSHYLEALSRVWSHPMLDDCVLLLARLEHESMGGD